jgi:hypothetical protein
MVKMANSEVILPVTASVIVRVRHEAGLPEKEIIRLAMKADFTVEDLGDVATHEEVNRGNVWHGTVGEAEVIETEEEDEEDGNA